LLVFNIDIDVILNFKNNVSALIARYYFQVSSTPLSIVDVL